jgi:hypothetical protein
VGCDEEIMPVEQIRLLLFIISITLISGIGDSRGFIHASKMWQSGQLILSEFGKSALGFSVGISAYWLGVKYLKEFGVLSPETQTLIWFGITIIGVAFISGKFPRWQTVDQLIAVLVFLGIAWLLWRNG